VDADAGQSLWRCHRRFRTPSQLEEDVHCQILRATPPTFLQVVGSVFFEVDASHGYARAAIDRVGALRSSTCRQAAIAMMGFQVFGHAFIRHRR